MVCLTSQVWLACDVRHGKKRRIQSIVLPVLVQRTETNKSALVSRKYQGRYDTGTNHTTAIAHGFAIHRNFCTCHNIAGINMCPHHTELFVFID